MRTVCFSEHLELEYQGNLFSKAIIAADVDNDNCNELVAGNINGELFIYKGTDSKPWIKSADLGSIACIAVGDACNHGLNYVICLSTEGFCHIFYIRPDTARPPPAPAPAPVPLDCYMSDSSTRSDSGVKPEPVKSEPVKLLKWMHRQEIRCNARVVLIADIDGDGQNEIVIGYTDRLVRAYKWMQDYAATVEETVSPTEAPSAAAQEDAPSVTDVDPCNVASSCVTTSTLVEVRRKPSDASNVVADDLLTSVGSGSPLFVDSDAKVAPLTVTEISDRSWNTLVDDALVGVNDKSSSSSVQDPSESALPSLDLPSVDLPSVDLPLDLQGSTNCWNGKLELYEEWQLAGQIGSMTVSKQADGRQIIVVSQPGGTFVNLLCVNSYTEERQADGTMKKIQVTTPSVVFHPLGSARARNPTVTTEVIDSISRRKKGEESSIPNYSAICTLDGTLTLVDDDKILWSFCVDHQLFALNKLDVTGDGTEEVVVCSWDGQTYIVNLDKDVVRFQFREHVAAFYAGLYTLDKDNKNIPCLFYATFNDKIFVYYGLTIKSVRSMDLMETISSTENNLSQLLRTFSCDATKREEVRQLYRWLLYGRPYHASAAAAVKEKNL